MLRGHHRDRLLGHFDAERPQLFVDVGEMPRDEIGVLVADVEVDVIESEALDLIVVRARHDVARCQRSEEHTSELQSLMRISYAVFCLQKTTSEKRIATTLYFTEDNATDIQN